jgi:hypothetical protein
VADAAFGDGVEAVGNEGGFCGEGLIGHGVVGFAVKGCGMC